jgi:hypothetical protein
MDLFSVPSVTPWFNSLVLDWQLVTLQFACPIIGKSSPVDSGRVSKIMQTHNIAMNKRYAWD